MRELLPFLSEVPELKGRRIIVAKPDRLVADEKLREPRRDRALHQPGTDDKLGRKAGFGEKTAQQVYGSLRRGIDLDLLDVREVSLVRDEDAVHRPVRRNGNAVDERVNGVAQKFETRDERDLQRTLGKLLAELARMIEDDLAGPPVNERTRVEILNATDPEQVRVSHALRANQLGLHRRRSWRHRRTRVWQMPVIAVPLHRFAAGFADDVLERRDRLFLRRLRAGHVKDFFFHDRAVQIVHAVAERDLGQRQSHRNPIGGEVIEVIEINAADREVAKLLDRRRGFHVRQDGRLRFEGKREQIR